MDREKMFVMICVWLVWGLLGMWGRLECLWNRGVRIRGWGNLWVLYGVMYMMVVESMELWGVVRMEMKEWGKWE